MGLKISIFDLLFYFVSIINFIRNWRDNINASYVSMKDV
jgi:hypothetical protein